MGIRILKLSIAVCYRHSYTPSMRNPIALTNEAISLGEPGDVATNQKKSFVGKLGQNIIELNQKSIGNLRKGMAVHFQETMETSTSFVSACFTGNLTSPPEVTGVT